MSSLSSTSLSDHVTSIVFPQSKMPLLAAPLSEVTSPVDQSLLPEPARKLSLSVRAMEYYHKVLKSSEVPVKFNSLPSESILRMLAEGKVSEMIDPTKKSKVTQEHEQATKKQNFPETTSSLVRKLELGIVEHDGTTSQLITPLVENTVGYQDYDQTEQEGILSVYERQSFVVGEGLSVTTGGESSGRAPSPSSVSSLTSGRRLEWDSGADVGYLNCQQDVESADSPRLSTIERIALAQGCSAALRLEPKGNTSSSSKTPVATPPCRGMQPPAAESTRMEHIRPLSSATECESEITPIVKQQSSSFWSQSVRKLKASPRGNLTVSLPTHQQDKCNTDGAGDAGLTKKQSSSLTNLSSAGEDHHPLHRSHSNASITCAQPAILRAAQYQLSKTTAPCSASSSSIATVVRRNTVSSQLVDKFVKRRVPKTDSGSSIKDKKDKQESGSTLESGCSSVSVSWGTDNVSQGEATEVDHKESGEIVGSANSFEYLPGNVYETGSKVEGDGTRSLSSISSVQSVEREIKNAKPGTFSQDLERSIRLLQSLMKDRKCDSRKKKQLIRLIVDNLVNADYTDDDPSLIAPEGSVEDKHTEQETETSPPVDEESSSSFQKYREKLHSPRKKSSHSEAVQVPNLCEICGKPPPPPRETSSELGVSTTPEPDQETSCCCQSSQDEAGWQEPTTRSEKEYERHHSRQNRHTNGVISADGASVNGQSARSQERAKQLLWIQREMKHLSRLQHYLEDKDNFQRWHRYLPTRDYRARKFPTVAVDSTDVSSHRSVSPPSLRAPVRPSEDMDAPGPSNVLHHQRCQSLKANHIPHGRGVPRNVAAGCQDSSLVGQPVGIGIQIPSARSGQLLDTATQIPTGRSGEPMSSATQTLPLDGAVTSVQSRPGRVNVCVQAPSRKPSQDELCVKVVAGVSSERSGSGKTSPKETEVMYGRSSEEKVSSRQGVLSHRTTDEKVYSARRSQDSPPCCCECKRSLREVINAANWSLGRCRTCGQSSVRDPLRLNLPPDESGSRRTTSPPYDDPRSFERKTVATETVGHAAVQTGRSVGKLPVITPQWYREQQWSRTSSEEQENCPCCRLAAERRPQRAGRSWKDTEAARSTVCRYCAKKPSVERDTTNKRHSLAYVLTFDTTTASTASSEENIPRKTLKEVKIKIPVKRGAKQDKTTMTSNRSRDATGQGGTNQDQVGGFGFSGLDHQEQADCFSECFSKCRQGEEEQRIQTLQEYLVTNRPDFVQNAETRRQCLDELAYLRSLRQQTRHKMLQLAETAPYGDSSNVCSGLPPPPLSVKRVFSQREMRRMTEAKYRRLPEVMNQKIIDKKKKQYRTNRFLADVFTRKLRKKVLKGQVNLSNSVSIISTL